MIVKRILVITSNATYGTQLEQLIKANQLPYQLTEVNTVTSMVKLSHLSVDRCIFDEQSLDSTTLNMLQTASLLERTIVIGAELPERAVSLIRQGVVDYIVSSELSAMRLQIAVNRPIITTSPDPISNLTTLVENAHSIHGLLDRQGNISYLNPIGVELLGNIHSLQQFCGGVCGITNHMPIDELLAHAEQDGLWQTEISYQSESDPTPRDLIVRVIPLRQSKYSGMIGYGLLAHDVTMIREADRQVENTVAQLSALTERKAAFISTISHELRVPLATILTSTEILQKYWSRISANQRNQRLGKIKLQVGRMMRLLEEVLLMDRLEDNSRNLSLETTDINLLVRELVDDLQEQHESMYDLVVEGGVSAEYQADPHLIRQAISNLLTNAIKYSPDGGTIQINLATRSDCLEITVQDHGIGIPADEQANLFNKFHRASNARRLPGTGLGLAISKRAVMMHNGTITFSSKEGVGTSFTINLPHPG